MKGFCEKKFTSMLISGTFTKAVMYLMLLSDSIIAGFFIGESGVAGINAITPVTAIVTFFGDLVSTGVGIVFTREVGAMKKRRADEIYGQGLYGNRRFSVLGRKKNARRGRKSGKM